MPSGPRVRANLAYGFTSDNPLTVGATTFNSAGLTTLPGVAAAHAVICFDPRRIFGEPEIAIVTSHTALTTTAAITRGAYGTTAREHPQNTEWIHQPVDEDYIEVLTSATRPSDPYRGQVIFETDTDKLVARSVSDVWQDAVPLGAWQSYTPAVSGAGTALGNGTTEGRFIRIGRLIIFHARFTLGTTSTVGTSPEISLPVVAATALGVGANAAKSGAVLSDATGGRSIGDYSINSGTNIAVLVVWQTDTTYLFRNNITATIPFTWAVNDIMHIQGMYEAGA